MSLSAPDEQLRRTRTGRGGSGPRRRRPGRPFARDPPPSGPTGAPAPWAFRSFRCGSSRPRRAPQLPWSAPLPAAPTPAALLDVHGPSLCEKRHSRLVQLARNVASADECAAAWDPFETVRLLRFGQHMVERRIAGAAALLLRPLCVEAPGRKPETRARYGRLDEPLDGTRRRLLAVEEGRDRQGPVIVLLLCPKPGLRH